MSWLVVLPVLIPLSAFSVGTLARRSPGVKAAVTGAGAAALLASAAALLVTVLRSGPVAAEIGSWPAPFGISLVADTLSALMLMVSAVVFAASVTYLSPDRGTVLASLDQFPLLNALMAGVNGAFLTADLFNLFVWFEVMLISSFVLLSLGRRRSQIGASVPYVAINLVASAVFLIAVGLLYGSTGALNMAELSLRLQEAPWKAPAGAIAGLLFVVFGIKAAVFPLFSWLPVSYHAPPIAVSALFAGLLTKVGVYTLIRMFTLLFPMPEAAAHDWLIGVSGLTMVVGVLGAVSQNDVRKILSFHIISQIGYMTLGLAINTRSAIAAAVFYVIHHIIVKSNLFLIGGIMRRTGGSFSLSRLGGLQDSRPWLAALFLIPAMSLAGMPPLSGFWAKYLIAYEAFDMGHSWIAAVALGTGILTLLSMMKIWGLAFWKPAPPAIPAPQTDLRWLVIPSVMLAAITVWIGLSPDPLLRAADRAASELVSRSAYIEAVLGEAVR